MPKPKSEAQLTPAVDVRGRMLMPLGGADYILRPSYEAIIEIEQTLGRSALELSYQAARGSLSITDRAVIIAEMMKAEGREDPSAGPSYSGVQVTKIARLVHEAAAATVSARLAIVLTAAVTGGYTASGEAKPATM